MHMRHIQPSRRQEAFTLVEMLLVLVILAVLAAIVIPKFSGRTEQAKEAAAKTQLKSIEQALETYEVDLAGYPKDLNQLTVEVKDSEGKSHGPYMNSIPNDPWGAPYVYTFPGRQNPRSYDLMSVGQDGRAGTEDDITNFDRKK